MLHCLVFKEQLCLSKLSLQATHLLYRISFRLSRTFLFFFLSESSAPARRFQSRSIFLPGRCLAATCIILQDAQPFVNRYLELFLKNLHAASDVLRFTMIRKKHRFRDAHLHMAGVAGLEPAVQESESCALPLGDTPSMRQLVYIIICFRQLSTLFLNFFKFIFQE